MLGGLPRACANVRERHFYKFFILHKCYLRDMYCSRSVFFTVFWNRYHCCSCSWNVTVRLKYGWLLLRWICHAPGHAWNIKMQYTLTVGFDFTHSSSNNNDLRPMWTDESYSRRGRLCVRLITHTKSPTLCVKKNHKTEEARTQEKGCRANDKWMKTQILIMFSFLLRARIMTDEAMRILKEEWNKAALNSYKPEYKNLPNSIMDVPHSLSWERLFPSLPFFMLGEEIRTHPRFICCASNAPPPPREVDWGAQASILCSNSQRS
jgi:hypothetical protein